MVPFLLPALIQSPAPANLIQLVRKAVTVDGAMEWKQTRVEGKAVYYGVDHDYSLLFDPAGRYVQTFKGPLGESFGYDGKTFWRIDRSRGVEKLDFEDKDRDLALSFALTSGWLNPTAPVTATQDGYTIHLKFKSSGLQETLKIDPATKLPLEADFPISSGKLVVKLRNWQPAGKIRVPLGAEITEGGLTDTVTASNAAEADASSAFAAPDWKPDDITFDTSKPAEIECKKAISGHVLVHPLINGQDVGWFILDSGAEVMVMDKTTADTLKLESVGHLPLTGVGGTVTSAFRLVDDFTIGQATLKKIFFTDLDLSQIGQILGIKLAGIVGADLFRRSIVSIDLAGPAVEIRPRDTFALDAGAAWLPVRFSTGNPAVEATIEGAPKSWYRFDTGANGTVTLHSPFVRKYNLLKGKKTTPSGSGGVGGMVTAQSGRVKWFELAGHRFDNPVVTFSTSTTGAFAEPYLAGNIGHDFMRPFKIVLDFSGYRLALVPRKAAGH